MANHLRGKLIVLHLLFLFALSLDSRVLGYSELKKEEVNANSREIDAFTVLDRHQTQLEKLEVLVKNLADLVSRLESRFSKNEKHQIIEGKSILQFDDKIDLEDSIERGVKEDENDWDSKVREGEGGGGGMSVTKYDPFWSEKFQFMAGVKLNSDATSVNLLPFRESEGVSKYFAVGDNKGRVYVFFRTGDLVAEFNTLSDSPITAMLSYFSVYKNDSVLVTGHQNGLILVHRVWETLSMEEWGAVHFENIVEIASSEVGESESSITMLEVHHVGRMRYILALEVSGKIRVFRENGALYGLAVPMGKPIAFLKQRLLFLTETGAGSLDLRTMNIKESECEGLNGSYVESFVFDATERSKAYGFTSDGHLIHVLLLGDASNFKCRVRYKKKFDINRPLSLQAIKGYLLIVNTEKVFVYNVSSPHYVRAGSPRFLFSARLDKIRSSFVKDSRKGLVIPLLASDKEKFVILGLGGGYVGVYRSNLPIFRGEFNTMLWSSPVLIFVLFLFGAWQLFARKKEALTSWGPDDPLGSAAISSVAPLPAASGDRAYTESSSRNGEIMDTRGGGLRGPPRRYVPQSQYPSGSSSSFRPTPGDGNPRPPSIDPNFRGSSELKFRGSNLETAAFQNRREGLFVSSQVADDSN